MPYLSPVIGFLSYLSIVVDAAAQDMRLQGRSGVVWTTINDGDLNPNQGVVDFGNVNFGNTQTRNYRIQNRSSRSITVRDVSSSDGAFTLIGIPSGSFTIAANQDYPFEIRFRPTAVTHQSTILVRSIIQNAANFYNFAVTGDGRGPDIQVRGRQGAGSLEIITPTGAVTTQNGTSFGTRLTGATYSNDFIIENLGNTALNLQNATIIGANAGRFELDLDENPNIQGGDSRTFEIRAGGATPGTYSATVSVAVKGVDRS